jgi:hypothetical protein
MYFENFLCQAWSHGQHLDDSCIAIFSKSLTLSDVYTFICSKLLRSLKGFPRLGAAIYTETAHEYTQSQLKVIHHSWYIVG